MQEKSLKNKKSEKVKKILMDFWMGCSSFVAKNFPTIFQLIFLELYEVFTKISTKFYENSKKMGYT